MASKLGIIHLFFGFALLVPAMGNTQGSLAQCKASVWKLGSPATSAETAVFPLDQPWMQTGAMGTVDLPKSGWTFRAQLSPNKSDIILTTLKSDHLASGELNASSTQASIDSSRTAEIIVYLTTAQEILQATLVCHAI